MPQSIYYGFVMHVSVMVIQDRSIDLCDKDRS